MTKIAINTCWGGFALSDQAMEELDKLGVKLEDRYLYNPTILRDDPRLIQVIEKLGKAASAPGENIVIVEIPDDVEDWYIHDYDGQEWICEGRTWGPKEEDKE
jgi:hypothetical protein